MNKQRLDLKNLPKDLESAHDFIKVIIDELQEKDSLVKKQGKEITQQKSDLDQYKKALAQQATELKVLRYKLHQQLLARFVAKSEKMPHQAGLFDEPVRVSEEEQQIIEDSDESVSVASYARKKAKRKRLPEQFPRETIIHDLTDEEKQCACGYKLSAIGEDKREQLEWIPARVKVIEHIRIKYSCKQCETVKAAPPPCTPIAKSIATPGLLSDIIVNKYVDHNPLYRQEKKLQRLGIDIARNTLSSWIIKSAELLKPLVDLLKQHILSGHYLQVDETTQQVLNEPSRERTQKSYLWVYLGGPPNQHGVIYDYHPSRSGEVAQAFIGDFRGALQCDGFSGYHRFQDSEHIQLYLCWAHARRRFMAIIKARKKKPPGKAEAAMKYIQALYRVEAQARENHLSIADRQTLRQQLSKPILEEFKAWLDKTVITTLPSSPLGDAVNYTLKHWAYLVTYLDNGEVEIDNNRVENAIRPFALGRRNWLFHNSVAGAKASAILYSLLQTCVPHKIEPYAYFKFILTHIKQWPKDNYQALLPMFIDQKKIMAAYTEYLIPK